MECGMWKKCGLFRKFKSVEFHWKCGRECQIVRYFWEYFFVLKIEPFLQIRMSFKAVILSIPAEFP